MDKYIDYFSKCKSLVNFLNDLKNSGLKQAYLFNSYDELKNIISSKLFALLINCKSELKPCLNCVNCKKILNNNSLDILSYPKNKSIVVEDIKDILDTCYIMPAEFNYKIYILNKFDEANIISQNKFLKTLEEPPQNVIFILNATNISKVLDTIKSRCTIINLPNLTLTDFESVFSNTDLTEDKVLIENCNAELGNYINLKERNINKTYEFCLDLLKNLNSSADILFYSSKINKDKENLYNYFYVLLTLFKDMLVSKINKDLINNKTLQEDILILADKFSYKATCEILNNLIKLNKELTYNTNETLVIDNILINILEERFKWK